MGESLQALIEEATHIAPAIHQVHNNAGSFLLSHNRQAQAVGYFKRACELQPSQPLYHYNHGLALMGVSRSTEAIESFSASLVGTLVWL